MWPILAGKEEEWRRLLQELEGSRSGDFGQMRRRLGIGPIRVWLHRTRRGGFAFVQVEVEDAAEAVSVLADSGETFEVWLTRKVEEFHGVVAARASPDAAPELVFRTGTEKET